jgi:hypothetical protein
LTQSIKPSGGGEGGSCCDSSVGSTLPNCFVVDGVKLSKAMRRRPGDDENNVAMVNKDNLAL